MSSNDTPTPEAALGLPWKLVAETDEEFAAIVDKDGLDMLVIERLPENGNVIPFILRAANAHFSLVESLRRARTLLDATRRYMRENVDVDSATVFYDEADCDGSCLADDSDDCIRSIDDALASVEQAK